MKKFSWIMGLLLALSLAFIGCGDAGGGGGEDPTGGDGDGAITYTAKADGTARKTTSTAITFTFKADVAITADDITITGDDGAATKGALTGSDKVWELAISGVTAGNVKVKIAKEGIEAAEKTVEVYFRTVKPIFKFTELLATTGLGTPAFTSGAVEKAGSPTMSIVNVGEAFALEITTGDNWGEGIDLKFSEIGFIPGDFITVELTILNDFPAVSAKPNSSWSKASIFLKTAIGNDNQALEIINSPEKDAAYTIEYELEDADITGITTLGSNNPRNIRIAIRPEGAKARIDEILVEGERPAAEAALAAPVLSATTTGVAWTAIPNAGIYEVYESTTKLAELPYGSTSINLKTLPALAVGGPYDITVKAIGIKGVSSDSVASNTLQYTKPQPGTPEVKRTIGLDSIGNTEIWSWESGDGPGGENAFKGKLTAAITAEIMGYEECEVWLYWEYVGETAGGIGNNWGIGTFGGVAYNATPGGMDGIAKILIDENIELDNGELSLNPYNDCKVVKIEVWAPEED